jgi:Electron transfer DM13
VSHRRRTLWFALRPGALVVLAVVAFALVWFQPQKLLIDERVEEAVPTAGGGESSTTLPEAAAIRTLSTAPFRGHEHATRGRARVIDVGGTRYVRFEAFSTSNGPLLKVYLSAAPAEGPAGTFDDHFVDLGGLKGNIGDQNYRIPDNVDLRAYRSVVVWCKRFGVPFAAATI